MAHSHPSANGPRPFAPCPPLNYTHHAGQGQEGGLHLGMVGVLEQVICLKDVVGLHPILGDGLDEVAYVLQLEGSGRQSVGGVGWCLRGSGEGLKGITSLGSPGANFVSTR